MSKQITPNQTIRIPSRTPGLYFELIVESNVVRADILGEVELVRISFTRHDEQHPHRCEHSVAAAVYQKSFYVAFPKK